MGLKIEMIDRQFNRWLVLEELERDKYSQDRYLCLCDCGTTRIVLGKRLRNGKSKSCGCYNLEVLRKSRPNTLTFKHGLNHHKLYQVWNNMKERCYNITHKDYKYYGGRGITMCDEWKNDVKIFYNWAIINGWKKDLEIDRHNNNGNYEPDNCRFITHKENCLNRSRTL